MYLFYGALLICRKEEGKPSVEEAKGEDVAVSTSHFDNLRGQQPYTVYYLNLTYPQYYSKGYIQNNSYLFSQYGQYMYLYKCINRQNSTDNS